MRNLEAATPLQLLLQTIMLVHTHRDSWHVPGPSNQPPVYYVPVLRDIQALLQLELVLKDPPTPLLPVHFTCSPAWPSLAITHPCSLQSLAHRNSNPQPDSSYCTHSSMHTHTRRIESLTEERARKEFNKKTGQTELIQHRAWPDMHADQATVYTQPVFFTWLPLCFPTLVLSQITWISPFSHLWFLLQVPWDAKLPFPYIP